MARVDVDTLTMEQYLALSRENQAPGVVKPEIRGNVNFKIKSQFMRELREDTFSRNKDEDPHDHIDRPQKDGWTDSPQELSIHGIFSKKPLSKGTIPGMRPAEALTAIQTMADHSQKWHDGTTSRNIGSSSSKDGLAALVNKLDNLGRDMKKLKESVHAIQVGCQICEGPHLDKDCPLNEEVKQVEEVRYGEFGRTASFNESNGGKFHVGPPGYYTKIDNLPPYAERRQSLEEILAKHQEESARTSTEMEIEQLTEEFRSKKENFEQAKVVTIENEGPSFPKKLKNLHGISFLSDSQEENTIDQLPMKESNPGHFTLPCTIGNFNFYAMADLGASVNVLPRNIFKYLGLRNLSEIEMLVEMADMRKKAPLGIVKDILVKIDKFMFLSDFVILDQTPNLTVILRRPFLATIYAQISVFEKEISFGIEDERVTFDINRNDPNFVPTEGIFMLNSVNTDEPITKRLKISNDMTTTHFCKLIIQECDKDFKAWPSCNPFRNECDGGHEIYGINELGKTKYWFFPNNYKRKEMKGDGVSFPNFLRYGSCQVKDSVWSKRKDLFRLWVIDKSTEALDPDEDPFGRCLDEYNWVFPKEIKQLADEYEIKIREKGQVLEEIWTKCKRARSKDKDWWYDYWYEDKEKTELGNEDYNPPIVHTETFEVTKYKFNNGCSFLCVSGKSNETLSLGRKNGSRFRKMIMEEMEETLRDDGEDSVDET
ncbi:zinc knuckle CX2CX4HX4C containing protein [Tanacetum coccineum]|uniref:Zinc knuckle CX2CX4HX4C containing protein n=1 Tax=Tanacetum coccineum TaxID=301880 RepID=A0ABQ5IT00_9ASTR